MLHPHVAPLHLCVCLICGSRRREGLTPHGGKGNVDVSSLISLSLLISHYQPLTNVATLQQFDNSLECGMVEASSFIVLAGPMR